MRMVRRRAGMETSDGATRKVNITSVHGLHARPCLAIVNTVRRHRAEVTVRKDGQAADGASMFDLLSLGATQGSELVLSAEGPEASQALDALVRLFANEFELFYRQ